MTLEHCVGCGCDYDASEAVSAAVSSEIERLRPDLATGERRTEKTYIRQVRIRGQQRRVRIDVQRDRTATLPYSVYVFIEEGTSEPNAKRVKMATYGRLPFADATRHEALERALAHLQRGTPERMP